MTFEPIEVDGKTFSVDVRVMNAEVPYALLSFTDQREHRVHRISVPGGLKLDDATAAELRSILKFKLANPAATEVFHDDIYNRDA